MIILKIYQLFSDTGNRTRTSAVKGRYTTVRLYRIAHSSALPNIILVGKMFKNQFLLVSYASKRGHTLPSKTKVILVFGASVKCFGTSWYFSIIYNI